MSRYCVAIRGLMKQRRHAAHNDELDVGVREFAEQLTVVGCRTAEPSNQTGGRHACAQALEQRAIEGQVKQ